MISLLAQVSESDPASWIDLLLGPLGLLVFLLITVWAFLRRMVVTRGTYDELRQHYEAMTEDRNRWRDMSLQLLQRGEKVAAVLEEKL